MSVVVRKLPSVVVRPSELGNESSSIKLSAFDRSFGNFPATTLFVYEHPIPNATETLKKALSPALVHYYPFSGRIAPVGNDAEFHILCNCQEAEFVTASANCALRDVNFYGNSRDAGSLLDDLAVYHQVGAYGYSHPLLSFQVTEFSCGGFILGVTWNHAIADGVGIAQFVGAVGELARGYPLPSIPPIRWDDPVSNILPLSAGVLPRPESLALIVHEVTVPWSLINRIKDEFRSCFSDLLCTTVEAVAAVLWQCRTRVTMSNPETLAFLSFSASVRRHVGAKHGYNGNCITGMLITATCSEVAKASIVDLIKMIKLAKNSLSDKFKKIEYNKKAQEMSEEEDETYQANPYDMLGVSSWRNLGLDEVDLGRGRALRVIPHHPGAPPLPFCVLCPQCKGKDGAIVLSGCVKQEHVDTFIRELGKFT